MIVRRTQEPAAERPSAAPGGDLAKRLVSGVIMAALALGTAWAGGLAFLLFWAGAGGLVLWEWIGITARAQRNWSWIAAGVAYAGIAVAAPVILRGDADFGFIVTIFLFAIVWSTDVLGYVVGRLIGGPKLWPAISPKKTWSGALGGIAGALAGASIIADAGGLAQRPALLLAIVLSIASQAGDLIESAIKRRFNVKDASRLIPGHGGVMDRLDGFIVAALIAALIGVARGGIAHPGRGLLAW